MKQDFFNEKFNTLPEQMFLNERGHLCLDKTKVDMIPSGLLGATFVYFDQKPLYIAPDFKGCVFFKADNLSFNLPAGGIVYMTDEEILVAKNRYIANREMVEKPRYNENGQLCSLPNDIRIGYLTGEGYYLDLTRTSVSEKQNLKGFRRIILGPKKPVQSEFSFIQNLQIAEAMKKLGR